MDIEGIEKLAEKVSSLDLAASREASRTLRAALTPTSVLAAWRAEDQRVALEQMLRKVAEVGITDIYTIVGDCLASALADAQVGPALLQADTTRVIPAFLLDTLARDEVELASRARPAVLALMKLTDTGGASAATEVGRMVDYKLNAEKALRLFDGDAAESEENLRVYTYLKRHTSRITAIVQETLAAFDTDPLLLANYLVVSGIISQREAPPVELVERVEAVLCAHDDPLCVAFVCRYCSIALFHREENAAAYAERWVRAALAPDLLDGCGEDTPDAALALAGAASTTPTGWQVVGAHLPREWLSQRLRGRSAALHLTTLRFLTTLLLSPYLDASSPALVPILRDAWQLRSTLEEPVRVAVWKLVRAAVGSPSLRDELAPSYASFLRGSPREESSVVRGLQLKVSHILSRTAALPDATKDALEIFQSRGLYPPGSAGVAEMSRD